MEMKFLEAGNGTLSSGCAVLYKEVLAAIEDFANTPFIGVFGASC